MTIFEPSGLLSNLKAVEGIASLLEEYGPPDAARDDLIERLTEALGTLERKADELQLKVSAKRISQFAPAILTSFMRLSEDSLTDFCSRLKGEIPMLIQNELSTHCFLRLNPDRKSFFEEPCQQWEDIIARFPDCIDDVEEMNRCYALSRYTAAVFHSLLVVEHGLIDLGKKIGVSDPKPGWDATYKKLSSLVNNRAGTVAQGLDFNSIEQVKARLDSMKLAWRNKVNHAVGRLQIEKGGFDDTSAQEVIVACRSFMRLLAE